MQEYLIGFLTGEKVVFIVLLHLPQRKMVPIYFLFCNIQSGVMTGENRDLLFPWMTVLIQG